MKVEKIVELYPRLYHMAERDSWESIKNLGLLSTSAVLDYFSVTGNERTPFESEQRKTKMGVPPGDGSRIILRDQKPMPRNRLMMALKDGTTPEDWYRLINNKVFFWTNEKRLAGLLNARDYRSLEHDVLTIDTEPFIRTFYERIWLCHMNSGNTWPWPHIRGSDTFCRIPDYPIKRSGNPYTEVVELVVDYSVPNISDYVIDVRRIKGDETYGRIL